MLRPLGFSKSKAKRLRGGEYLMHSTVLYTTYTQAVTNGFYIKHVELNHISCAFLTKKKGRCLCVICKSGHFIYRSYSRHFTQEVDLQEICFFITPSMLCVKYLIWYSKAFPLPYRSEGVFVLRISLLSF